MKYFKIKYKQLVSNWIHKCGVEGGVGVQKRGRMSNVEWSGLDEVHGYEHVC